MSDTSTAIALITIAFVSRLLVFYARYMHFNSTIIVEGRCKNRGKLCRWSSTLSAAPSIDISRVVRGEERSMLPHDVSRHLWQREGVPCGYW